MTVSSATNEATFPGNGVATVFPLPFRFFADSDIIAQLIDSDTDSVADMTLGVDYTLTGAGDPEVNGSATGALITVAPVPTGFSVFVRREIPLTQPTDIVNQGRFYPEIHEAVFDRLTMLAQQLSGQLGRALLSQPGFNYYDAEGRQIKNVADPTATQDAATLGWAQQYIASILATGQGPINNAANVVYTYPDGSASNVQSLSGSNGADGIGWRLRTVADRLNDTANVKDYGAIADGTLHPLSERFSTLAAAQAVYPHATALTQSIDWAAAQAALNSGSPRVHFPGEHYLFNDDLTRNSSVMLAGDGTTILEFTAGKRMTLAGSLSALPALSANVTTLSRSLPFASSPGLVAGDVVLAYNPTDYSWSPHRSYYRQGEFFRVHSVSGNTANIFGLPAEDYAASAMQMYKVNGIRVAMQDLIIFGEASTVGPIVQVQFGVNVSLFNVETYGGASYSIEFDRCYQVDVLCGSGRNNSPYVNDEYGLIISNSQRVTITGGDHVATRHAIALGGGNGTGSVPCRDIFINNMSLINNGSDIGAADMHGNSDRVIYNNCHITHANMAGRDVTYRGCIIYQRTSPSDGSAVYGSEIVGGTFLIENCTLITAGDLAGFGAITLDAQQALKYNLNVTVRNLIIKGGAGSSTAKIVKVSVANGETKNCNVDVRGLRCELTQALCVLFLRCESNTSYTIPSNGHIVDDIYGPSGMALIQNTGAAITGIPTRQMEQIGEVTVTADGSGLVAATSINFRYPYSKKPTATACASGVNGATFTTLGSQSPVPIVYTLSATAIRPALVAATSTFTNGAQAVIGWRAGIREI